MISRLERPVHKGKPLGELVREFLEPRRGGDNVHEAELEAFQGVGVINHTELQTVCFLGDVEGAVLQTNEEVAGSVKKPKLDPLVGFGIVNNAPG